MNRATLRRLAEERALEAQALLAAGHWSGAYYLVGYGAECGLKACILAYVEATGAIFADRKYSEKCWTHDLEDLAKLAGLEAERGRAIAANPALDESWKIVKEWDEAARYREWTEIEARVLCEAVTHTTNGVLSWIRVHW